MCIFVNTQKKTSDTGAHIHFAVHRHLAKKLFNGYKIFFAHQFEQLEWPYVHRTLSEKVPKLFQPWACKQVMQIAPMNKYMSYRDNRCTKCPWCTVEVETTKHVLHCLDAGRVEAFHATTDYLDIWMGDMETDPDLMEILSEFVHERVSESMEAICFGQTSLFSALARSQDAIGWQRLIEGMVSAEIATLKEQHLQLSGSRMSIDWWMTALIIKLLEITHGQWLYRNVMVHDSTTGTLITKRNEDIQLEIESQEELGS